MVCTPEDRIKGLVVVHSGVFHADDVFFVAFLTLVSPSIQIVRTRKSEIIEAAEIVGDVGGICAINQNRYDHHQKGGAGARLNGVPFASFGLIWSHTGWTLDLIGTVLRGGGQYSAIARIVDESLVQAIDASDCGFTSAASDPFADATPRYSLSMAISAFNPDWSEDDQDFDAAFARAVEFAQMILRREIISAAGQVEATLVVKQAITEQTDEPEILILNRFCPWQNTVLRCADVVKFVVFPSETGDWRVQAVPVYSGSYETRMSLPATWAGLRTAKLAAAVRASGGSIGDDEAAFCHDKLFIGGATTFEGAMQMARAALPKVAEVSIDLTDLRERA